MICDDCKKNAATVHYTTIINGQKQELHLCEECAGKRNELNLFTPFSMSDFLASFLDMGQGSHAMPFGAVKAPKCSSCGMTYTQFQKIGRLGCSNCYNSFKDQLSPVLRRLHGSLQHSGKIPRKAGAELRVRREMEQLKAELSKAIQMEAFEKAAELRDKIRELEKKNKE